MIKILKKLENLFANIQSILIRFRVSTRLNKSKVKSDPKEQQLDVYWTESFKNELNFWGEDTVWREIELLFSAVEGNVVDICCGVGGTIKKLEKNEKLKLYGFDISDYLIDEAINSGLSRDRLKVANATNTGYEDNYFDYSYSIGSLEHFTENDIDSFLKETKRITKKSSFHQIPVARDKKFDGWLELDQSYFNKPVDWWLERFEKHFDHVSVIESSWNDPISFGKWFICK